MQESLVSKIKKTISKEKSGWVYGLDCTRADGTHMIYIGMTKRSPYKRWREHFREIKKNNSKTWVGKSKYARPIGAIWSSNAIKAEKTIKKYSPKRKRALFISAARKYNERRLKSL